MKRLLKADQNPPGLAQRGGRLQKNNWGCLRHSSYQLVREGWQRTTACMKLPQAVSVLASWFEIHWSLLQSAEGCQGSMVRFAASGTRINGSESRLYKPCIIFFSSCRRACWSPKNIQSYFSFVVGSMNSNKSICPNALSQSISPHSFFRLVPVPLL